MTELTTNSLVDIMVQCCNSNEYKIGVMFQQRHDLDSFMKEIKKTHDETPIPGVTRILIIKFITDDTEYVIEFNNNSSITFITMNNVDKHSGEFHKVLYCGVDVSDSFVADMIKHTKIGYVEAALDADTDSALDDFLASFIIVDK